MKKQHIRVLLVVLLCTAYLCVGLQAQEPPQAQTRWEHYDRYARWSVGANIGLPFFAGDFQSNAFDKLHWGISADLQAGYQFTPVVGVRANLGYAQGRAGAKDFEQEYWLDPFGWGDYRVEPLASSMQYKDLYSKVRAVTFSLHADINLNNLIRPVPVGRRRWTVSVSPGIYFQKFYPDVRTAAGGHRFATEHFNPLTVSVGGEAMLRWKAGRAIDLQARYGISWIHRNVFDGVATYRPRDNQNFMTHFSVGVVWKIGARHKKKDHLMYAARYIPPRPQPRIDTVVVRMEPQIVVQERTVVQPVEKPVWYYLPTIHFDRGSAEIDTERFASQLDAIVRLLAGAPETTVHIRAYADRSGSEQVNLRLSGERAEALRNYLIGRGIAPQRIVSVEGRGVDTSLTGRDAYSLMARRAEVVR